MSFAGELFLVAALGSVSLITGRLLVGALKADLLRRLDPANAGASLAMGSATLVLGAVGLSAAGWPAPAVVRLLGALHLVPLALSWRWGRLDVLRPRGRGRTWVALLLPAAAAAVVALLPVLRTNGFSIGNDTYTYCAYAEWLQQHGFREQAHLDPTSPVASIPWLWQQLRYDLGVAHVVALVQAATGASTSLLVYPAVAAWGMVLLVASLVLVMRWVLGLPSSWAGMAALLFAVAPHAVYLGHHGGSLQQTYALPLLLAGIALLTRSVHPRWWLASTAVLLAVPFAFLVVVYLPILPLLSAAAAVTLLQGVVKARRGGRGRRALVFLGSVVACVAVFALRDLMGVVARYSMFLTDVPGGHIPFGTPDFVQLAAGTRVLAPGWTIVEQVPWSALNRAMTPVYLGLAGLGLWQASRRGRTLGLAAVTAVLLVGVVYYAALARDPWTNQRGHTWSLFKLCQWAFPALFLLGVLGARRLARSGKATRLIVPPLLWALYFSLIGVHWIWSERLGLTMRQVLPGPSPLRDLPALKRKIQELPPGTLLVLARPANVNRWLAAYTSLLAYPRSIVGDWWASASMPSDPQYGQSLYASLLGRLGEPGIVPILAGFVPFEREGVEELGGGYARVLPSDRPLIVHVINPDGLETDEVTGRPVFDLGERRTKIVMYSPVETAAELTLRVRTPSGSMGSALRVFLASGDYDHRNVRLGVERGSHLEVPIEGLTALHLPVWLSRGLTTAVLVVEGGEAGSSPPPPLTVVELGIAPARP